MPEHNSMLYRIVDKRHCLIDAAISAIYAICIIIKKVFIILTLSFRHSLLPIFPFYRLCTVEKTCCVYDRMCKCVRTGIVQNSLIHLYKKDTVLRISLPSPYLIICI